ncbi:MAG: SRPBCC family protein [Myxococcota bacterium]
MNVRTAVPTTFVIDRVYRASPARVFAAFADPALKPKWFGGPPEWGTGAFRSEFRVGGREISRGGPPGQPIHTFDARYHDIVPNERIVMTYDLYLGDARMSVSLATVEFRPNGAGTALRYTEQGVFLDGLEVPGEREEGTRQLLDALGRFVDAG